MTLYRTQPWKIFTSEKYSPLKNIHPWYIHPGKYSPLKNIQPWYMVGVTCRATHIKRTHKGHEGKHQCNICNKKFYNYTRLTNHKLTHGGEKSHFNNSTTAMALRETNFWSMQNNLKMIENHSYLSAQIVERSSKQGVNLYNTKESSTRPIPALSAKRRSPARMLWKYTRQGVIWTTTT